MKARCLPRRSGLLNQWKQSHTLTNLRKHCIYKGIKMKLGAQRGLAVLTGMTTLLFSTVAFAAPSWASGNDWDWCDKIIVKSHSTSQKTSVFITGRCDGGRVAINGTMNPKVGQMVLRGYVGSTKVNVGAKIGNYTAFIGYMGYADVTIDGSGSRSVCDLGQIVDSQTQTVTVGNLFSRICPILNGMLK